MLRLKLARKLTICLFQTLFNRDSNKIWKSMKLRLPKRLRMWLLRHLKMLTYWLMLKVTKINKKNIKIRLKTLRPIKCTLGVTWVLWKRTYGINCIKLNKVLRTKWQNLLRLLKLKLKPWWINCRFLLSS